MKLFCALVLMGSVASADPLPESLDRAAISKAMDGVKAEATACGPTFKAKGVLKVKVKVAPDGTSDPAITETPAKDLGDCVLAAMKKLTFPPTQKGGVFSYPFVF